ncbi:methylenetetrahydrofolate reductase [NAD(P)H] [Pelagibacterium limicola]|uniref:methylenetetrahydrofolate reductase [NAD(P)H] n=1 Tax=Pelagibacterium limicola TaxID=2791022 RepID=UPI0018AF8731|nr:methylenetetrahydrofolate reductase [NAD(P)H] [Pelagibacterium limicola]
MTVTNNASPVVTRLRPARRDVSVSFEFFPPKSDDMEARFWESLDRLAHLRPRFVSVTYGAGGTTRERTLRMVTQVKAKSGIDAAAHLTCVGASRDEVDAVVRSYALVGVNRIVALRGDPPTGIGEKFEPHPDGYRNAAELVAGIRKLGDFDISVAAYPEKHPQSPDWDADIDNLKRKIDAGANRAITQMFFENADYWRFIERARKAGITAPIVPGIQPIHNFKQIAGFAARCGTSIPDWLAARFEGLENDPVTHERVAAELAVRQVNELLDSGVREFHFYTLNRADLLLSLTQLLGLKAAA